MHICIHPDGEVRFSPAKKSAFVDPKKYFNLSSLVNTYFFLDSPGWSILSSHDNHVGGWYEIFERWAWH